MARKPPDITADTYLTTHELGGFLQVNPSSINKWIKEGRIACYRTPGGHRRIRASDAVVFLLQYKMPVPPQLATAIVSKPFEPTVPTPKVQTKKPAKKSKKGARR